MTVAHWLRHPVYIVAVMAVAIVICYMDRANIATALIPMTDEFHWSRTSVGVVMSAFYAGYCVTQSIGGFLADRLGGKRVLFAGVALWSLCTAAVPACAALSVALLAAARVALGLGEGVAFPAVHSLIAERVPVRHQSKAVGVVTAASYVGGLLSFGLSPTIIKLAGWPWCFWLFAALAVPWCVLWWPVPSSSSSSARTAGASTGAVSVSLPSINSTTVQYSSVDGAAPFAHQGATPDAPVSATTTALDAVSSAAGDRLSSPSLDAPGVQQHVAGTVGARAVDVGGSSSSTTSATRHVDSDDDLVDTSAPLDVAAGGTGSPRGTTTSVSAFFALLWALLHQPSVWAIIIAQYGQSYGMYGMLTWLPSYFHEQYNVDTDKLATFTVLPFVTQAVVGLFSGMIADTLLANGAGVVMVRRALHTVGSVGPAFFVIVAALWARTATVGALLLAAGSGLNALTLASVSVHQLDITNVHAGIVFGCGNTASTIAGLTGVGITTLILRITDSWSLVLLLFAAHYLVGGVAFIMLIRAHNIDADVARLALRVRRR